MKRLERLIKYLVQNIKDISYRIEGNTIKIKINNGKMEERHGTVYVFNQYIVVQFNLWLRKKDKDLIDFGIVTERRMISVSFHGEVEIKESNDAVIITLEPRSEVSISAA